MTWHFWILPVAFFWFFGFRGMGWHSGKARAKVKRKFRERGWTSEDVPASDRESGQELEDQHSYIGSIEPRLAELENRLDFTERLLAGRADSTSQPQEPSGY